jgi:hypothetical protein
MKIVDWIQGKVLNLDTMEIEERDDLVIIPAWQFALLIRKHEEYRHSMIMYFVLLIAMFVLWVWSVYLP